MNEFDLAGKVALISGGARGLGAEMAQVLAAHGAKIVIGDVLEREGRATAERLGAKSAFFVHLDVTREEDWQVAFSTMIERFGSVDIVVNNAGIETTALLADCTLEDFNRTQAVNLTGTFLGIKHAICAMRPGGPSGRGGSIINISSAGGLKGAMGLGAYCASKGGVRLLTKVAAIECGRLNYGIRVNSVHPALIMTAMGSKTLKDYVELGLVPDEASAQAAFKNAHLIGLGEPRDVANSVLFLASDAARWITGTELSVDGGFMAA